MPRPSPQTDRVIAVIELLSTTERGATMTEIANALALNQASCVHMLAALTTAGFVAREPDRRYHLGPALARPGRIAAERYPVLVAARPEMAALSAQFDLACFAFASEDDHARLVHYTWPASQLPPAVKMGDTVPLTPPLGMVFAAWGDDDDFSGWLALDAGIDDERAAQLDERRRAVRELGFVVELAPPPTDQAALVQVLDDRASPYRDNVLHRLLAGAREEAFVVTDLADAGPISVTGIAAPVFGATGGVVLGLNLVTLAEPLTAARIAEIGPAVRRAADRVTATVGGRSSD